VNAVCHDTETCVFPSHAIAHALHWVREGGFFLVRYLLYRMLCHDIIHEIILHDIMALWRSNLIILFIHRSVLLWRQ
jgi:hypothetical protein